MKSTYLRFFSAAVAGLLLLSACNSPSEPQPQPSSSASSVPVESSSYQQEILPLPEPTIEVIPDTPAEPVTSEPAPVVPQTPAPAPNPTPVPVPSQPTVNTPAPSSGSTPSVEVVGETGVTLDKWIADNVSGGTGTQNWALEQYKAAGADTRWQPSVIALKRNLENALSLDDYAGIDYVSVTRTDTDGYSITLYTGLHIYTVNDDKANAVIASVMQSYDQTAGKVALITSHAKRPLSRLLELEREIRTQSFWNDKISGTSIPVFKGFTYEKGGLVVLLSTKSQKLANFIAQHPDGTAIGFRVGDEQQSIPSGGGTSSGGTSGGTVSGTLPERYWSFLTDDNQLRWVQSVYTAYNAKEGWRGAVQALPNAIKAGLSDTEYASVDLLYEISPYDPTVTIPVGVEVYAVNTAKAKVVTENARKQQYNESLGNLQIKYTNVKLSKRDLENTMAELEQQSFFRNKDSKGTSYVIGWYITKGTVEIWLTEKFPALDAYLNAHPNGHAIGYITGKKHP